MVCKCENEQFDYFIAGVFNQCISGSMQVVSFIFGWISIASWLVSLYPQIRMNILLRKSEALSQSLLICWISSDICTFVSCFVLDKLFTQKFLVCFWLLTDVCIISTHLYFNKTKKVYESLSLRFRAIEIFTYAILFIVIVNNIVWAGEYGIKTLQLNYQNVDFCKKQDIFDIKSARFIIGNIFAYSAVPFLGVSRIGQIIKNFKRKSVTGLSLGLFVAAVSGNANQIISVITMNQESNYLIGQIPFIICPIIVCLCDLLILGQYFYYQRKPSKQSEEEQQIYYVENKSSSQT